MEVFAFYEEDLEIIIIAIARHRRLMSVLRGSKPFTDRSILF